MSVRPVDGVDRRRVLKAAAWSAPVIAIAVAAPAVAASTSPDIVNEFAIDAYTLSDLRQNGERGPLEWAGGHIGWWYSPSGTAAVTVVYTAVLRLPDGTSQTLVPSTVVALGVSSQIVIPKIVWGAAPIPAGTYTVTFSATVDGHAGLIDVSSLTIS